MKIRKVKQDKLFFDYNKFNINYFNRDRFKFNGQYAKDLMRVCKDFALLEKMLMAKD